MIYDAAPSDALCLVGTSHATRDVVKSFDLAAAVFALTRPSLNRERCTLRVWIYAWKQCVEEVEAIGYDARYWARAACIGSRVRGLRRIPDELLDQLSKNAPHEVVGILAMSGLSDLYRSVRPRDDWPYSPDLRSSWHVVRVRSVLMLLSNGSFAFTGGAIELNDFHTDYDRSPRDKLQVLDGPELFVDAVTLKKLREECKMVMSPSPSFSIAMYVNRRSNSRLHEIPVTDVFELSRRRARDGHAYTDIQFASWYSKKELASQRWKDARSVDPLAESVAMILLKGR